MLRLECALTCPGSAAIAAWYAASAPSRSPRSSQQDSVGVRVGAPRLRRNRHTVGRHRAVEVPVIPVILQQDAVQDVRADEVIASCRLVGNADQNRTLSSHETGCSRPAPPADCRPAVCPRGRHAGARPSTRWWSISSMSVKYSMYKRVSVRNLECGPLAPYELCYSYMY